MLQLDMDWWLECVLFSPRHFASSSLMKQKHSEQEVWYPFLWFWQPGMWFLASYSYWVILPCLLTSQDGCGRCLSRLSCGVVSRSGGNFHSTANLRSAVIWALQCRPCHRNSATAQRGMVNRFDRCCQLLILRCQSDLFQRSFTFIGTLQLKKQGMNFPLFATTMMRSLWAVPLVYLAISVCLISLYFYVRSSWLHSVVPSWPCRK